MRNIFKLIGVAFCLTTAFTACNKEPEYYSLPTPEDQMHIKASVPEVVLLKDFEKDTAVTFTWAKADLPAQDVDVTYAFRFYMASTKTNVSEVFPIGKDTLSISFTHEQLNNILAGWHISPNEKISVVGEIVAQYNSTIKYYKPEVSKVNIDLTGYAKSFPSLYMVMTLPDGQTEIRRLAERATSSGIYMGEVDMVPCNYYLAVSTDANAAGYFMTSADDPTFKFSSEMGVYPMFTNEVSGKKAVIVDLNQGDIRVINPLPKLPNGTVAIVGNACDAGWVVEKALQMDNSDLRYPEIFTYTGNFNAGGEFKLTLEGSWGGKFFYAPSPGVDPQVEHRISGPRNENGQDYKWTPKVSGQCKLTLNISEMTIDLTPIK